MTSILNLPNWTVIAVKESDHDYEVEAVYTVQPTTCTHCGKGQLFGRLYRHGTREQTIMDLPAHGKQVGILLTRNRYRCRDCGKTFLQPLPDVDEGGTLTKRLIAYIEQQSIQRTFTSVADDVGVDEKTVRNIFNAYVAWLDKNVTFQTPEWLGIDEIQLLKKYRCVFTNIKERTIVGVISDRKKGSVSTYLKDMKDRERVQVVTMDMWKGFKTTVNYRLPNAVIVIDKFHVVRMANYALDGVRKSVRAGLSDSQRKKLMHDRFLLLKRPKDLKADQKLMLDAWLGTFPVLETAYNLKESFFAVYDQPDKQTALAAYQEWKASMSVEMQAAYQPLLTALTNWETEIFAYFDWGATNACTEALNGITKVVNRLGRGYSFKAIRAKMLYSRSLQKKRRPAYGEAWKPVSPATESPGAPVDIDVRQALTGEPLLGTDIVSLLALVDSSAAVEMRSSRKRHTTPPSTGKQP